MSDQTQSNIKYLEEELDRIEDEDSYDYTRVKAVIQDLKTLNNYRAEMDKMEKVFEDTEMPFEGSEGDHEFHGIEDLEVLAEAFVELKEENEKLKKENEKHTKDYEKLDKHRDWIFEQYELLVADTEKALKGKAIYRDYLAGNYKGGRMEYIVKDIRENYNDEFCEFNDWSWTGLQELFDEN